MFQNFFLIKKSLLKIFIKRIFIKKGLKGLLFLFMFFFLFSFFSFFSYSSNIIIKPTLYENNSILLNPNYAYDDNNNSFANLTINTNNYANASYFGFQFNKNYEIKKSLLFTKLEGFANLSYFNGSQKFLLNSGFINNYINFSLNISNNNINLTKIIYETNDTLFIYDLFLNISYDDDNPLIFNLSPEDNFLTNNSLINISFVVNDESSGIKNCSLLINGLINQTNSSIIENKRTNFSIFLDNGIYNWSITCYDNSSFNLYSFTKNYSIRIDKKPPLISLVYPENNSLISAKPVNFTFFINDTSSNLSCNLYINNNLTKSFYAWPFFNQEELIFLDNGVYNWSISCYDNFNNYNLSKTYNFSLKNNLPPIITNIKLTQNISLTLGSNNIVSCNATISDSTSSEIILSKAKFYFNGYIGSDNSSFQYTNDSCKLLPLNETSRLTECTFNINSYSRAGTWVCEIIAFDNELNNSNYNTTEINPFYAINITPAFIDYGLVNPNSISNEKSLRITNIGNSPIDLSIEGFGNIEGDGFAAICDLGNISVNNEHYSLTSNLDFDLMDSITSYPQRINIDLDPITETINNYQDLFFKIKTSYPLNGTCQGYLIITAIPN